MPASRAAQTAASTFSTLCAPFSGISATGSTGSGLPPSLREEEDALAVDERSLLDGAAAAEPEDLRLRLGRDHLRLLVLGVQDQEVVRRPGAR